MEEIRFSNSIKTVAVKDDEGETLCVLKIDSADGSIVERFADMLAKLERLEHDARVKADEAKNKYAGNDNSIEAIVEASRIEIEFLKKICDEVDRLFGAGTIRNVFHLNYELNPEFVPDEILLIDFLEGIIPIIEKIYSTRMESKRTRFNVNRNGGR